MCHIFLVCPLGQTQRPDGRQAQHEMPENQTSQIKVCQLVRELCLTWWKLVFKPFEDEAVHQDAQTVKAVVTPRREPSASVGQRKMAEK